MDLVGVEDVRFPKRTQTTEIITFNERIECHDGHLSPGITSF